MNNARAGGEGELCQTRMAFGERKMDGSNNTSARIANDPEVKYPLSYVKPSLVSVGLRTPGRGDNE